MVNRIFILLFLSYGSIGFSQSFTNGDLEGNVVSFSDLPSGWQSVSFSDPECRADQDGTATPDLTDLDGPDVLSGIFGNAHSGTSFVSGLDASLSDIYWHEGIQQSVPGFTPGNSYGIYFYQTVVKQNNPTEDFFALDQTGSWAVYVDDYLVGISDVSQSFLPFDTPALNWELRSLQFTATANSHVIKFLPQDDDSFSDCDINTMEGIRMGIDSIHISSISGGLDVLDSAIISLYPNPTNGLCSIDLGRIYSNVQIKLFDINGSLVLSESFENSKEIDVFVEGAAGVYQLSVETDQGVFGSLRIIKK